MTLATNPEGTCIACGKVFQRFTTTQRACRTFKCATKVVKARMKAEKEETRARRLAVKPRSKWLAEAQQSFNAWVRLRDQALPCVSCLRHHGGQYHAGHYLTVGARPELRFDPLNVHKQCSACNEHLHGNLILYRVELVKRIGLAAVEALEGPHPAMHYSVDDLRIIKHVYRQKAKAFQVSQPA